MPNSSSEILVELNTPRRGFFKGYAKTVELRADTGVIAMKAGEANYLSLTGTTEITLCVDRTILCFVVKNATASQQDGRLIMLAESIHQGSLAEVEVPPKPRWPGGAKSKGQTVPPHRALIRQVETHLHPSKGNQTRVCDSRGGKAKGR